MSYDILKNRMTNGTPFVKETAVARINSLADTLVITQEQATELIALAEQYGVDILPENYSERITKLEATDAELYEALDMILKGVTE